MKVLIIAGDRIIDNHGSHAISDAVIAKAEKLKLTVTTLEVVSLAKRWEDKLSKNQFKSGASAMAAVNQARKLLEAKKADVVVIKGADLLRSGYTREERESYMKLYNKKYTPLDGYTKLVPPFLKCFGIKEAQFKQISSALFENYARTWQGPLPESRWFAPVTKYFRGVDCANPNIDYSGQIVITDEAHADLLRIPNSERVSILGNAFTKLQVDGYE